MPKEKTIHRLTRGALFNSLDNATTLIGGFILSIIIARSLGPANMGVYGYCTWLLGFVSIFSLLAIPSVNTRFISELSATGRLKEVKRIFSFFILYEIILSAVVTGAVIVLAFLFYSPDMRVYVMLAAANLLPTTVFAYYSSTFKGFMNFRTLAITNLITMPIYFGIVVMSLALGMGVKWLLIIPLFIAPLRLILYHRDMVKIIRTKEDDDQPSPLDPSLKKRITDYWYRLLVLSLVGAVVFEKSEVFFLEIYADISTIAFYTIAFSLSSKIMKFVPYSLSVIFLPAFTEKHATGNIAARDTLYSYSLKYLSIIIAPILIGGCFVAPELISTIYGAEYLPTAPIFRITLLTASLSALFSSSSSLLGAMEETSFLLRAYIVVLVLNIVLDVMLIPGHGLWGAAWANFFSQTLLGFSIFIYIMIKYKISVPVKAIAKVLVASLLCGSAARLVLEMGDTIVFFVVSILVAVLLYPFFLAVIRTFDTNDREILNTIGSMIPPRIRAPYLMYIKMIGRLTGHTHTRS